MTGRLPRADMIQPGPQEGALWVVYDSRRVRTADVRPLIDRLHEIRGVKARLTQSALEVAVGISPPAVIVEVVASAVARPRAVSLLKQLANPQYPITISYMQIQLWLCRCGWLSSVLDGMSFLDGFGPEDKEAFVLRYYAGIKRLRLARLYSAQPQPPYTPLAEGIEGVLKALGAHAAAMKIMCRRDPRLCKHPR